MHLFRHPCSVALALAALMCAAPATPAFLAAQPAAAAVASSSASSPSPGGTDSLEQAAKRAGDTARKVAMYLIGTGVRGRRGDQGRGHPPEELSAGRPQSSRCIILGAIGLSPLTPAWDEQR